MATLDEAIAEIEKSLAGPGGSGAKGAAETAEVIVKARVNVSNQYGIMLEALNSDGRLDANPELRDEFAQRLRECRHQLARHQVRWPMKDIADNLAGYHTDAQPVSKSNRGFVTRAKSVLAAA